MQFPLDQLGKNLLRDFFAIVGKADTEVEVPLMDAPRIDVCHTPDPELLRAHGEIEPGLLRSLAEEAGAVEVYSRAPSEPTFLSCVRKRAQWHHALQQAEMRSLPLPWMCLVCAGRPAGVIATYGFEQDPAWPTGVYATQPRAWRVRIVAIGELPRIRSTVLVRLLGSKPVRRQAVRDLAALPGGAWEKRLAAPWLIRVCYEAFVEPIDPDERNWAMQARSWAEEWCRKNVDEPVAAAEAARQAAEQAARAAQDELARERQEARQMTARLFEMRLGRPLTDAERSTLIERLGALGQNRVGQVAIERSADAVAAWLADPGAR